MRQTTITTTMFLLSKMQYFPSQSHLSLLNKKCIWWQQCYSSWAASFGLCGPLPFSSPSLRVFRVQRLSQEFRFHQTKLSTCFLGLSGFTPVLWPHYQFLITYLLAQSLISFEPDLISLQLRLICMAVNTGLTKLTNCDKSKGNLRPLETQKSAFCI